MTTAGWEVLRGQREAHLRRPGAKPARTSRSERIQKHGAHSAIDLPPAQLRLFDRLKEMRRELARDRKIPAYMILHDSVLLAITEAQPLAIESLARVAGMGKRKLLDFGDDIIDVVSDWHSEEN